MSEQKQFVYTPYNGKLIDEAFVREVMMLHEAGWSNVAIGKRMGRHSSNIQRLLKKLSSQSVISDMTKPKQNRSTAKTRRAIGIQAPEESGRQSAMPMDTPMEKECHDDVKTLEQKVKQLERELSEARLERDLYNEIINVAEKKFDIQIRKKAGTKQ